MDRHIKIYDRLKQVITDLSCELNYKNIYELLIAVVLSAQCTDKRVNIVTPSLFQKFPDVYAMATANQDEVEKIIMPCGTYHIKAKNIIALSRALIDRFDGQVPNILEDLITLPGVGRKTASVILAEGYKIPALPVDTHVLRVSNRLGLADTDNPNEVERILKSMYPKEKWIELHYLLLLFGRYHCKAVGYKCKECILQDICNSKDKKEK